MSTVQAETKSSVGHWAGVIADIATRTASKVQERARLATRAASLALPSLSDPNVEAELSTVKRNISGIDAEVETLGHAGTEADQQLAKARDEETRAQQAANKLEAARVIQQILEHVSKADEATASYDSNTAMALDKLPRLGQLTGATTTRAFVILKHSRDYPSLHVALKQALGKFLQGETA